MYNVLYVHAYKYNMSTIEIETSETWLCRHLVPTVMVCNEKGNKTSKSKGLLK